MLHRGSYHGPSLYMNVVTLGLGVKFTNLRHFGSFKILDRIWLWLTLILSDKGGVSYLLKLSTNMVDIQT